MVWNNQLRNACSMIRDNLKNDGPLKNTPGTWGEAEPLTEARKLRVGTVFAQMVLSCLGKPRDLTTFKEQYDLNLPQTYLS